MIISKETEQRQLWLNGLKVGDEVIIKDSSGWGTNYRYSLHTVTKITPSRMMDVGRYRFNNDGEVRGNYGRYLIPTTPELKQQILVESAIYKIKKTVWESLTPQQILDVLKVIKNDESK